MSESERQNVLRDFVSHEVLDCQTMLVEECLRANVLSWDDVVNLYESGEDEDEDYREEKDICGWWVVTDWFAEKLRVKGEPILSSGLGTWWGRTCTGQAISMDHVVEKIHEDLIGWE